jgi:gamma-glutamyltranspeptidase/glutathione hydrolase
MRRTIPAFALFLVALLLPGCAGGGARGIVVADHPLAAEAGAEMLRKGGNAVDAAVATSFALSVVRPESCGIGGGGFMLIRLHNDPRHGSAMLALDYRERAPGSAAHDMFESLPEDASRESGHAVAVPGTVAGLLHALDRYGSLDRAAVLAPAIRIAETGFWSDDTLEDALPVLRSTLDTNRRGAQASDTTLRRLYLQPALTQGRRFIRNPEQAAALRLIAADGAEAFYSGPIAGAIIKTVNENGGAITARDLESYRITESRPLKGEFRGRTILTMPLPSSGGVTLLQILRLVELRPDMLERLSPTSGRYLQLIVEAFKFAFADRAEYFGDPEFGPDPTRAVLADSRLKNRAKAIDPTETFPPEHHGTSHLCVVDRWGSAVACTETINLSFGARLIVPEYGFCLNNQMDDFLTRRGKPNAFGLTQSDRNLPAPGKRPLSSMTPTIVLTRAGDVEMVVGASGGPRIITATLQVMLNVMLLGMNASNAVDAPRVHHQWQPNKAEIEDRMDFEVPGSARDYTRWRGEVSRALVARGHVVINSDDGAAVQIIWRGGSGWQGAADPRKGGSAVRQ